MLEVRFLAVTLLLLIQAVRPDVADARGRILLVFDEDKDFPGLAVVNRSLREAFTTDLGGDVEFYSESLNLSQFPGPDDQVLRDHFRRKYRGVQPDLIVAVMGPSLGELTASIAHEISQPLSAILTNAQASLRLNGHRGAEARGDRGGTDRHRRRHRAGIGHDPTAPDPVPQGARGAGEAIASTEGGPREIRIAVSQPDTAQVAVAIRDSGIGVSASELERIFEHFVSNKPQGLGMGLAFSRSIVEAHGGTIWATRNEDRGLTLHVALPASR